MRSVAYGTLARRDRKLRHLSAAAYLESSWSEEEGVAEVIARTSLEAFEADTDAPDAAGLSARLATRSSGPATMRHPCAAAAAAEHYYERALELAAPDDRADAPCPSRPDGVAAGAYRCGAAAPR